MKMSNTTPSAESNRPDFMVLLGLLPPYTLDDIQQSYRQLALKLHPDRGGKIAEFVELQTAYERAKEYIQFRTDKRKWIAARIERYAQTQSVAAELEAFGAEVDFSEAEWLQKSFGDFADLASGIRSVRYCNSTQTEALIEKMIQEIDCLRSLRSLDLTGSLVTNGTLLNLRNFPELAQLNLCGTKAGNRVLHLVKDLRMLERVDLAGTRVGSVTWLQIQRILTKRKKRRPVILAGRT
jgi:hypothetical protein